MKTIKKDYKLISEIVADDGKVFKLNYDEYEQRIVNDADAHNKYYLEWW